MKILCEEFTGEFFDADYFERGKISGKGWLMDYRWMPQRSFREAFAYIDFLGLDENSKVLDFGCAKGFIVRALNELEIATDGCDISNYALSFAPECCWNSDNDKEWAKREHKYTHIICKDVLEHLTITQLDGILEKLKTVGDTFMCVIPMGESGTYRIPEYHAEISHLIAENEQWWGRKFGEHGWAVKKHTSHVPGLKDNWKIHENGNHVFVLVKEII